VPDRIAALRRLGDLARVADDRLTGVGLGPRVGLLPPLARARNRFSGELAEVRTGLRRAALGAPALADVLGGPRRYLVFAANNAEMRAGSGMFLSVGELVTGPEGIELGEMRSVTEVAVPPGAVPLEGDLADRWGWLAPNQEWRNLMTSPRFDAAAPLAARMWEAAGNQPVDGVLVLDPVALSGLLTATGPVTIDGRDIGPDDVVDDLLHDQYVGVPPEGLDQRREQLGRIAGAVFDDLDAGEWSAPHLADGLAEAAAGRHLLLWSAAAAEQAGWQALGVDGSVGPDSLSVAVLNRAGNKLDPFLGVSADLDFATAGPDTAGPDTEVPDTEVPDTEVTLRIELHNDVPEGEPSYVAGPVPGSGAGEGVYLGILSVTLPGGARDARFDGVDQLAVAGADGPTRVVGFQLHLARGERRTVVARFRLPGSSGVVRVEPSARVPAIRWSSAGMTWSDFSTRVLTWQAGPPTL
jgi:hypothetical protein